MIRFRLTCPDCNAVIITSSPEAMVWELCPHCREHAWDRYDALMADVAPEKSPLTGMGSHTMMGNARDNN